MSDPSGTSHFQSLFDVALQDYEKKTGTKLADHPLARQLESCDSVESVAALLQQLAQGLNKSRGDDGKVMTSLMRVVHVLYTLSPALGEAVSLPFPPAKTIFAGLAILLSTVKDVSGNYETLADLLESIEHFLSRLDIYAKLPLTTEMAEVLVKIMVELLSVIALVTKQVRQKRPIKFVKRLLGENEVGAALQRLDRLTQDEARTTAAQTLEVVYGLVQNITAVMDHGQASIEGVQEALEHLQQNASRMNKPKRDRLRRDIRNWLSPPDPTKNHNIARGSHHSGTATWFIHGTTFSEWKYSGSNSLLWINGKPGAGKSILCSTIIEDIETMRKRGLASLAYFYCDFRDDQKKDRRGLLTSLLFQLCDQSDSYATVLSNFYSTRRGAQGPPDDALTQCLTEMLSVPDQAPVYIILDALDECPNTSAVPSPRTKVLTLLQGLVDSQLPNLHICVSSRPEPDINLVLDPLCSHSVSIHGEKGQRQDIDDYIKSVVDTDPMMQKWSEEDKQLVIDVLARKADGMFRWVYCQLVYLGNCLPGRIRRALDQLPESLDETYERTLRDIDGATFELAHCLFQCVSVASRPLRVGELTEFLAFDFEAGPIPEFLEDWRPEDPIDAVLSTCRSLLAVVDVDGSSFIQFSHFSVKEFLTSTRLAETKDAISRRYHVDMTRAHTLVARACLGILLHLDDEYVTSGSLETFPLAEYAALHWLGHAQYENVSGNIQEGTKRLFDPGRRHLAVWLWICDLKTTFWRRPQRSEKPSNPRGTPLHYAAVCGLQDVVRFLLEKHVQVVDARGFYRNETPLSSACRSGHLEVVRVLLEYDANAKAQDARKSTPLHRASEGGHLDVVRLLIKYGADASAQDVDKSTPLHGASQGGHLDVARLLLEQGANANAQDADNSTPLHWASQGGHLDIAQVLLEHGADARAKDGVRSTPLHGASQGGHLDVAQVLLERGADATAQDEDKWTPLHRASEGGHLSAVRVLLKHGADAKAQDVDKWTPLHRASQRGRLNVVRALLEHGADAGAPTKQKWTPLHWASQGGHLGVARLLLEFGADARAKTKHKWTALHWAAERGHLDIARVLLEYGADASAQNDKNWTPFQEASEHGHRGVMQLLMEHGAVELGFNQYGVGGAA